MASPASPGAPASLTSRGRSGNSIASAAKNANVAVLSSRNGSVKSGSRTSALVRAAAAWSSGSDPGTPDTVQAGFRRRGELKSW